MDLTVSQKTNSNYNTYVEKLTLEQIKPVLPHDPQYLVVDGQTVVGNNNQQASSVLSVTCIISNVKANPSPEESTTSSSPAGNLPSVTLEVHDSPATPAESTIKNTATDKKKVLEEFKGALQQNKNVIAGVEVTQLNSDNALAAINKIASMRGKLQGVVLPYVGVNMSRVPLASVGRLLEGDLSATISAGNGHLAFEIPFMIDGDSFVHHGVNMGAVSDMYIPLRNNPLVIVFYNQEGKQEYLQRLQEIEECYKSLLNQAKRILDIENLGDVQKAAAREAIDDIERNLCAINAVKDVAEEVKTFSVTESQCNLQEAQSNKIKGRELYNMGNDFAIVSMGDLDEKVFGLTEHDEEIKVRTVESANVRKLEDAIYEKPSRLELHRNQKCDERKKLKQNALIERYVALICGSEYDKAKPKAFKMSDTEEHALEIGGKMRKLPPTTTRYAAKIQEQARIFKLIADDPKQASKEIKKLETDAKQKKAQNSSPSFIKLIRENLRQLFKKKDKNEPSAPFVQLMPEKAAGVSPTGNDNHAFMQGPDDVVTLGQSSDRKSLLETNSSYSRDHNLDSHVNIKKDTAKQVNLIRRLADSFQRLFMRITTRR